MTRAAGKPAGRPDNTSSSARSPPAEEASATISKFAEECPISARRRHLSAGNAMALGGDHFSPGAGRVDPMAVHQHVANDRRLLIGLTHLLVESRRGQRVAAALRPL